MMQNLNEQRPQLVNQGCQGEYIALNIYPEDFIDRKPTQQEIKKISKDIALEDNCVELTPDELVERVTERGHAFLACTIKPIDDNPYDSRLYTVQQINFGAQELLVLDIDNDNGRGKNPHMRRDKHGYWTWQDFLDESLKMGFKPWLIYPSANHGEGHHRYRVIYRLPAPVEDWRVAKVLNNAMNEFWPMADDVSRTLCSRFYGATKGYFHRDDDALIDPSLIAARFPYAIRRRVVKEDQTGRSDKIEEKYSNALAVFAHRTGMAIRNGAPMINTVKGERGSCQKTGDRAQMHSYIYANGQDPLNYDTAQLHFIQPEIGAPTTVSFQFTKHGSFNRF